MEPTQEPLGQIHGPTQGPTQGSTQEESAWGDRSRRLRVIIGGTSAAAVLALGGFGLAVLTTPSSAKTPNQASTDAASGANTPGTGPAPGRFPGAAYSSGGGFVGGGGFGGGPFMPGGPGGPGAQKQLGTVTKVSAGSFTVTYEDGSTTTFTTNSSTTYEKDGSKVTASALQNGEHVSVISASSTHTSPGSSSSGSGTPSSTSNSTSASNVASVVDIVSPSIAGTVVSVSSGHITVADDQGFWRTVNVTSSTTYTRGGQSATAGDVKAGEQVVATGAIDSDHTSLDASSVEIVLPSVSGSVKSVSGSVITLQGPGSSTVTVDVTGSTVYKVVSVPTPQPAAASGAVGPAFSKSTTPGTLSDVKAGDLLSVQGTKAADGTYDATSVTISQLPAAGSPPAKFVPGHFGGVPTPPANGSSGSSGGSTSGSASSST